MVLLKEILQGDYITTQFLANHSDTKALQDANALFVAAANALLHHGVSDQEVVYPIWVPARIEVLGKHTDYAGGQSLVGALSKGFAFIAHPNKGLRLFVLDAGSKQQIQVDLSQHQLKTSYSWGVYLQTVIERVRLNFGPYLHGASIAMASNIPAASGMSSSSALITGLFLGMKAVYSLGKQVTYQENIHNNLDLADYLGYVENGQTYRKLTGKEGVGTFGGSQDHTAILCSKAGKLSMFSFRPTQFIEDIALPEKYCFVIGCSGVRAEKTKSARDLYNRCAMLVHRILACKDVNPDGMYSSLGELVNKVDFSFSDTRKLLKERDGSSELEMRLFQFVKEAYEIIPGVVDALRSHDYDRLGQLVDLSQELAHAYLKNQVEETNYLARSARAFGAIASSAFGAGFGGSVWALVEEVSATQFRQNWEASYLRQFPEWQNNAQFFVDTTGDGVIGPLY